MSELTTTQSNLSVNQIQSQVAALKDRRLAIQNLYSTTMTEGVHYGPGWAGAPKPSLHQAGAQMLINLFGFRVDLTGIVRHALPGDHVEYVITARLFSIETGHEISQGVGSCSTMEAKYRWRQSKLKCPDCDKETLFRSKEPDRSGDRGYYCYKKVGGCGLTLNSHSELVTGQVLGKIENPDIADQWNTVLKMAKKRAMVDAVLNATGASDMFTQDAEDFRHDDQQATPVANGAGSNPSNQSRPAQSQSTQQNRSQPPSRQSQAPLDPISGDDETITVIAIDGSEVTLTRKEMVASYTDIALGGKDLYECKQAFIAQEGHGRWLDRAPFEWSDLQLGFAYVHALAKIKN